MTYVVLLAAGRSERFGENKMLAKIRGKMVLSWSLETLQYCKVIDEVVLVVSEDLIDISNRFFAEYEKVSKVVLGGSTRKESSKIGVSSIEGKNEDVVLIHDAARPFASCNLFKRVAEKVKSCDGVVPVVNPKDTIAFVQDDQIISVPPRKDLRLVQTPQGFKLDIIKKVHEISLDATDDSSLALKAGFKVCAVKGERTNMKITYPEDLIIADALFPLLENFKKR
jgi:2-C-methyl-D-erythritol 4-phosphate cytidylyltransferase